MSKVKTGRIYGYEFAAKLQEMSASQTPVSYGVIYPFLRRMEKTKIVRSRRDESSGRVYYELTREGKTAVQELPQRLKDVQEDASDLLRGPIMIYLKLYGRKALDDMLQRLTEKEIPVQ
jgi:DNA-binding PadR family transcriptional regulator